MLDTPCNPTKNVALTDALFGTGRAPATWPQTVQRWENNLATNMSGGQQQRVAIARALAMNPALILAAEPTGNLDTKSADSVFEMMRQVNAMNSTTFLIVTHNLYLARRSDRIAEVVDGRIVDARATPAPLRPQS